MDLYHHYQQIHNEARLAIEKDAYHIDDWIKSKTDDRYGITLLLRPDKSFLEKVVSVLEGIQVIEPHQYHYPKSDIHLTVLSIISCHEGFHLSLIDQETYVGLIREELDDVGEFSIHFRGIVLSKTGILMTGFPDPALNQLRERLRGRFKASTLRHSIDSRYTLKTAHSTIMRFCKKLDNKAALIEFVEKHRNTDFGILKVGAMELVGNDWYQKQEKTVLIKSFNLGSEEF